MRKLFVYLLFSVNSITIIAQLPNFDWAKSSGGLGSDGGSSITVDIENNIYATGSFSGTVDFDPGSSILNLSSNGNLDIFITKFNTNGNLLWTKTIGGTSADGGRCIKTDSQGNVYVTGWFNATVDFNPGTGINNITSTGQPDVFILKLDKFGNFMWAKQFGGIASDMVYSMAIDTINNALYITGYYEGVADFDPGSSSFNLTSAGQSDIFITKLDLSGLFIWAKSMGGSSYDLGKSITVDNIGNIYTTGNFTGSPDFDPGASVFTLTSTGNYDIFVSKLTSTGNFIWAKSIGTGNGENVNSIICDTSGNIYFTGTYSNGLCDFDPNSGSFILPYYGSSDIFIEKMNSSGNFVWVKQLGGYGFDEPYSIGLDKQGNVYTAGIFSTGTDFDPGGAVQTLPGQNDAFISKLDNSGNYIWAVNIGNNSDIEYINSFCVDDFGNIYSTGVFNGTSDFDPSTSGNYTLTTNGDYDVFYNKLNQNIYTGINDLDNAGSYQIYPNPFHENFIVEVEKNMNLSISSILGEIILTIQLEKGENEVNLHGYPNGIYFIRAENQTFKIIKQ